MNKQEISAFNRFIRDNKLDREGGYGFKPWARESGLSEGTIRSIAAGRTTSARQQTFERLATGATKILGKPVTIDDLLGRKPTRHQQPEIISIPTLTVRAAAGGGYSMLEEQEDEPLQFRKPWLETMFGGDHGRMRIVHFQGDSMLPTIRDGDLGMVLTGLENGEFISGQIYVLWDGTGLVVKRLESLVSDRPSFRVISDNRALHEPYTVDAKDVHIVGRVVWRGGKL
jgi:phage repressor protein C with HTH and peptisase S24 domain